MDWQQAQKDLITNLTPIYGDREASIITDWVLENLSGWRKLDRLLHRSEPLPPSTLAQYTTYTAELLNHRPVQYVLHESWFAGMRLYVDENVLIPRPETEELVDWVLNSCLPATGPTLPTKNPTPHPTNLPTTTTSNPSAPSPTPPLPSTSPTILDVGTGSGCIALALAKNLPSSKILACDTSTQALAVARRNAQNLHLPLSLFELDFLDPNTWHQFPPIDCLVSNPPYIPLNESPTMSTHVTSYEPHLALFVPTNDPLLFYRALCQFALQRLSPGNHVFMEIHEDHSLAVVSLFEQAGFTQVTPRKDLQGKDRMVKATR
ncbi:MAG: peptide chain release factor N(5)-glutamine methyltransferase [Bacteroidetes bacterium]|nr:peptide chain release factor N(5)-glutamine methyltransferase [Bacteroidota bacterium]